MRGLIALLAVTAALAAPGVARAQAGLPPGLFQGAPSEDRGAAGPTDGGRSTPLLALAAVAVLGAGALAGLGLRPRRRAPRAEEPAHSPERFTRPAEAPVIAEPRPAWRPRGVSDLPPLPAFGSGPEPPEPPQRANRSTSPAPADATQT